MSIRTRWYCLLSLAMAPLILALLYNQADLREERLTAVHRNAMQQAGYAAGELRVMVSGMKNLLMAVSHMPAIRPEAPESCSTYMKAVHQAFPSTIAIGAADLSGNIYCLSRPMEKPLNIADRYHFQAALQKNDFAVGQHVFSRTMKVPSLPFSYPIRDDSGKPVGVAFSLLSLSRLAEQLTSSHRSSDVNVIVTDHRGVMLADLPGMGRTGEAIDDAWRPLMTGIAQSIEITDPRNGRLLIVAFLPLQGDARGLAVAVAIDKDAALKHIVRLSDRDWVMIAAALMLAFIMTWLLSGLSARRAPMAPEITDESLRP